MCQDDTLRRMETVADAEVVTFQELDAATKSAMGTPRSDTPSCGTTLRFFRHATAKLAGCVTSEELHEECVRLTHALPGFEGLSLWLANGENEQFTHAETSAEQSCRQMRIEGTTLAKLGNGEPLYARVTGAQTTGKLVEETPAVSTIVAIVGEKRMVGVLQVPGLLADDSNELLGLYAAMVGHYYSMLHRNDADTELRALIDAMVDCVHVIDRDMNVRLFNQTARAWCSELEQEISPIGRKLLDIFPFLGEHIRAEYAHVFETGQACFTCEKNIVGGSMRDTTTHKIPITRDGEITRILTIVREITDETRIQRRNTHLHTLSIELATATSVVQAFSLALDSACAMSQATAGAAWMRDVEDGLRPVAVRGVDEEAIQSIAYLPPNSTQAMKMVRASMWFGNRTDVDQDLDTLEHLPKDVASLAHLPIRHENTYIGCVVLGSVQPDAFSRETRTGLEAATTQLGTSVARLKAQQELQESVQLYSLLTDSISDIVCTFGLDLRLQYASLSVKSILGYKPSEVVGRRITSFLTAEGAPKALKAIEHAIHVFKTTDNSADYAPSFEFEMIHKNGSTIWGELTTAFLRTPEGQVTGILAVIRDVSERKRSEASLQRRDALLQTVASAGEELLRNPDCDKAMELALEMLGTTAGIDQIHVYQMRQEADNRFVADCHMSWLIDDECALPKDADRNVLELDTVPKLRDALLASKVFTCTRSHMSTGECNALSDAGVLAMVAVPLIADGELWGFIGFVDCKKERVWLTAELDAVRSAASVLSAGIQQQQTKEALRTSEELYRELVQNASSKIIRLNADGTIAFANNYACDFSGYELEELIGRPVIGTITPEIESSGRNLSSIIADVYENPDAYTTHENENINSDGERRWVAWTNRALHDSEGNLTGLLCIGHDVTEIRKAADELRWHKRMTDQSHDHIVLIGTDYRYKAVNARTFELFDVSKEQIVGQHIAKLLGREYFDTIAKPMLDKCFRGYEVDNETWFTFPASGRPAYVHIDYVPYVDEDGSIAGAVVTGHDITDRKRAAEELEEANRFADNIISFAHFGIVVLDRDLRYMVWNPFMEELTGLLQRDAIGKYPADIFTDVDQQDIKEALRQATQEQNVTVREAPYHVHSTGKSGWTVTQYKPYRNRDNEVIGIIGVVQDITERRQFEQHQHELAKLESIGALAGGLAHDFNNHLMAIIGNITLARLQLNDDSEVIAPLLQAEHACIQARNVTKQLLTFAKGGEPVKELLALEPLIRSTVSFTMSGAHVQCVPDIAEDLWPAEVDEGQINQVLQNLLINSTQAMPDGGEIQIRAENIIPDPRDLPQLDSGPFVRITVQDEGIGIPQHHLARIFDPYFSTKQMGSGLGLATSHSIIMRHGGCIEVASIPGEGTTFEVYLPAAADVGTPASVNDRRIVEGRGHILVMDDDELVRRAAAQLLQSLGYTVETVPDGVAAIELYKHAKAARKPFDMVIFDLTVPGKMGGEEAIKELQTIDATVKAIASSGYANSRAMASYADYGFASVIAKPYTLEQLSRVVAEVMGEVDGVEST